MLKAILFDMDGVLIDSHDAWLERFNASRRHFGFKDISAEDFDRDVWARNFVETVAQYFPGRTVEDVRGFYFNTFRSFKIKRMPGADEALMYIKSKGLKTAVVSNTQTPLVDIILEDIGIRKYFDIIVGGERVKNAKPNPEIVMIACKELDVDCSETIFIGDTIYDKQAAQKAGCKFVGFRYDSGIKNLVDLRGMI
ncbi:MAG TPA: HAD family hydrolase [Candidatus Nanoarchaeia archaeon]|nr:HAD family hydrolase [Candidatus Nanoarchaeia archaeon]